MKLSRRKLLLSFCGLIGAGFFSVTQGVAQEARENIRIGVILPTVPAETELRFAAAKAAHQGTTFAAEEFSLNAEMFDIDFSAPTAEADGADVVAAAERLIAEQNVFALAGGFSSEESRLLAEFAIERNIPFINLMAADDRLRSDICAKNVFHVAPSAAMYLDAIAGWYIRAGLRKWFIIQGDDAESASQFAHLSNGLKDRHFGVRIAGNAVLEGDNPINDALLSKIKASGADFILLLTPSASQLEVVAALDAAGFEQQVTGFPHVEAQTRAFLDLWRKAAPKLGTGMRALAWEPTLDAYGAREINARYMDRWNDPMSAPAWAAYQGIKMFFEARMFGGSTETETVLNYMGAETSVFDVWKGIGTSFRPWDHQLRQPLYLAKVDGEATDPKFIGQLVGELPAIYMPGTDPVERLDQIGVVAAKSSCRLDR